MGEIIQLGKKDEVYEKVDGTTANGLMNKGLKFLNEVTKLMALHKGAKLQATSGLENGGTLQTEIAVLDADETGDITIVASFVVKAPPDIEKAD